MALHCLNLTTLQFYIGSHLRGHTSPTVKMNEIISNFNLIFCEILNNSLTVEVASLLDLLTSQNLKPKRPCQMKWSERTIFPSEM